MDNLKKELEEYLESLDVKEMPYLGINLPLKHVSHEDFCKICCWIIASGKAEKLPNNLYNRILLGEKNKYTSIIVRFLE